MKFDIPLELGPSEVRDAMETILPVMGRKRFLDYVESITFLVMITYFPLTIHFTAASVVIGSIGGLVLFAPIIYRLSIRFILRAAVRSSYRGQIGIYDRGLLFHDGTSELEEVSWGEFTEYREGQLCYVLSSRNSQVYILPKEKIQKNVKLEDFDEFVRSKIKEKH